MIANLAAMGVPLSIHLRGTPYRARDARRRAVQAGVVARPIRRGAVYGVVKEMRSTTDRPLLVTGLLADQLARELAAGGDAAAVRSGGRPDDVAALLYVIGDDVTE